MPVDFANDLGSYLWPVEPGKWALLPRFFLAISKFFSVYTARLAGAAGYYTEFLNGRNLILFDIWQNSRFYRHF